MAKIGTAHIEIKPVLSEEALNVIAQRIEDAVAAGVKRGMNTNVEIGGQVMTLEQFDASQLTRG